mgnify:CR=1 FL=1
MKHVHNFFRLFVAILSGTLGILLFGGLYKDFSPSDPSYQMIFTFLGSTFLITLGMHVGFLALKKIKNS